MWKTKTKNTESKNPKFVRTKKEETIMLLSKCVIVKNRNLLKKKKPEDKQII